MCRNRAGLVDGGRGQRFLVVWISKHGRPTRRFDMGNKRASAGTPVVDKSSDRAQRHDMLAEGRIWLLEGIWMVDGTDGCKERVVVRLQRM
jgi:hypothetical protein